MANWAYGIPTKLAIAVWTPILSGSVFFYGRLITGERGDFLGYHHVRSCCAMSCDFIVIMSMWTWPGR